MPSYTTSLKLLQPSTGEYPGSWGSEINTRMTSLVDAAVAGTTTVTMTAANVTLTNANGVADQAKSMFLVLQGSPGGSYEVIVPSASKLYFVTNSTGFAQTVKTSAGSGISVPNGASMTLRCDGTDVVAAQNYFASMTLGSALPVASGGTGAATFTANNVLLGNGTSALQVVAPGTAGNILTSNGTTWASSAPASAVSTISFGSTGLTPSTATSGAVSVAGTLATTNGGTGLTSFTSGGVVYASSTSALATGSGLVFDGSNLGIGTSSPIEKLAINQGNIYSLRTGGAKLRLADQNNEVSVESLPVGIASEMVFKTNTVEHMRIDKDGNLGIGTSSPGYKLSVNGDAAVLGQNTLRLQNSDNTNAYALQNAGATGSGNAYLSFVQSGVAERMRLDSSGSLGIGTNSPGAKLHVNGTGSTYIRVSSTNAGTGSGLFTANATNSYIIGAGAASGGSGLEFRDDTNSVTRMVLTSGGNFGIGTTTVEAKLHVSGNVGYTIPVTFAGAAGNAAWTTSFGSQAVNASILATDSVIGANIYSVSDERLKSNITPIPENAGLEFVKVVDPVSFDWKTDNSHDTGFIAQALMTKGYGHLVSAIPDGAMEEVTHEDGNVSPAGARFVVRYDSIVPILHAAIRDQQALIEALMARVTALEQACGAVL